uniref:Neurotransmitter-gated ion-channel ligand-binding domain-containing protein n=1 Tax=Plectus sambesii TaxID=2011161 RepID=A0A914W4N9_9BILA
MILLSLHVTFIISITVNGQQEALTSDTARLKSDLFKNYDHAKPAKGTIVYLVFVPTYMQPSETEEVMFVTGQMFIYWHDTRLVWAPEAYNGITKFQYHGADRLNNVNIWVPKIIATTVDGFDYRLVRLHLAWLVVHSYGLVEVQLNWGDQISCIHDHASFPYDQNNCSVSFHSIAPTMSGTDGWQFELQAGTITESSI